ncbi:MAG: hypothetical protein ACPKOP_04045 [Sphaerochaetaceae bacterium]
MKIFAQRNKDDPSRVDFYAEGQLIENMFCQSARVSGGRVEARARVVAAIGTGEGASDENNSAAEEGVRLPSEREQGSAGDGPGEDDVPSAKRHRKKAAQNDERQTDL